MVKDPGKAEPDGRTRRPERGKCFKMFRREEQRSKSRGRGVSKLDSLEMLSQRGG